MQRLNRTARLTLVAWSKFCSYAWNRFSVAVLCQFTYNNDLYFESKIMLVFFGLLEKKTLLGACNLYCLGGAAASQFLSVVSDLKWPGTRPRGAWLGDLRASGIGRAIARSCYQAPANHPQHSHLCGGPSEISTNYGQFMWNTILSFSRNFVQICSTCSTRAAKGSWYRTTGSPT